jgi:hypothetical protein
MHVLEQEKEIRRVIAPSTYKAPPNDILGIWPFTSEKEAAQEALLREYDWAFFRKMTPHLGIWESTKVFFIGPDWSRDFFTRYMKIAEEFGPYTDANYEIAYKPRLLAYYDGELLKAMLDTLAQMYMDGEIPEALYNPGAIILDDESPIDKAFQSVKEGAVRTGKLVFKTLVVGGLILGVYYIYTRRPRRRAA